MAVAVASVAAFAACGKKGPPLPPVPRVPAQVATVTATRIGGDVYLSFVVPNANADGRRPADEAAVEIHAITSDRAPQTDEQRELAALAAAFPVRPVLPEPPPLPDGSPAPPLPLTPGVDQGATAVFRETLTPEMRVPVALPTPRPAAAPLEDEGLYEDQRPVTGALVAPPAEALARRYYFVEAVSPRGRKSVPSSVVAVPLDAVGEAPGRPEVTYTATSITLTWPAPPDAKSATIEAVPTAPPAVAAAPGNQTPAQPPLPAKSLGFTTVATTYHVYDVSGNTTPEGPFSLTLPAPITPQPVAATTFTVPGVSFGVERCFAVRAVNMVAAVTVQTELSPRTCITPRDTFAPAAPRSLAAIAGAGVINLIWDANAEPDLAGYLVLRGEAPGDTLQPLTPSPVNETTYRDTDVRPGVRYVYVVVAVDNANPPNRSAASNRVEETARQ